MLYQCGVFPPLVDEVQEVLKSDLGLDLSMDSMAEAKLKYFSVPLQSVAVSTSIPASMMVRRERSSASCRRRITRKLMGIRQSPLMAFVLLMRTDD